MRTGGLDIGSRTIKYVVLDGPSGKVAAMACVGTTPGVAEDCRRLLEAHPVDRLLVTGYGRTMAEVAFDAETVTEIKAHARGAQEACPGCRFVLDIGGQDTKVIAVDGAGLPTAFEMNDRCAAGAGRFIEIMASVLGYAIEEFGSAALSGGGDVRLNSMCAVFAESEVVGLMTQGWPREAIARGIHRALVDRIRPSIARLSCAPPIVFAGGGARNPCLVAMFEDVFGRKIVVPDDPQSIGALGAALLAAERATKEGP